ncbi:hypothetical protein [Duncaniella muris]|uniref:hypothetical protein n=1 Tax=Duncaniella muris TaxID=2094150 RepID=UPI002677454C|nr:hypothetical protein [Duncaniella muris]
MSINNDNIVKIGVALKWRNTFDLTKKYYQENVVTACGCVFRCKVLQAQGKTPIKMTDDQGHIVYTNTDVWDVLVDMAYYYNYAVDTRKLTQQMLDYTKKLDEAFQKQQKEIEALQEDNRDQWGHINDIEKVNTEQQRELNSIFDTISCFSEGIWIDTLLWSNETIWDNNKYAITDDLQNQINVLDENHRQVAYQLRAIGREQTAQDDNIAKLGEHFGCFVDGVWGDLFIWNNDHLWANGAGVIDEAIADTNERIDVISEEIDNINQRAEDHQSEYQKMLDDIRAYNGCFEKGEWADPFFWNDTDIWYNSPNSISEAENDIISHNSRLTALESQFALFIQQYTTQQTIIEQHQNQLETLMDCFTVLNVGKWQNLLLWDNTSKWSNALITEAAASVGTGGSSTVTVKSYDPDTATVTI